MIIASLVPRQLGSRGVGIHDRNPKMASETQPYVVLREATVDEWFVYQSSREDADPPAHAGDREWVLRHGCRFYEIATD